MLCMRCFFKFFFWLCIKVPMSVHRPPPFKSRIDRNRDVHASTGNNFARDVEGRFRKKHKTTQRRNYTTLARKLQYIQEFDSVRRECKTDKEAINQIAAKSPSLSPNTLKGLLRNRQQIEAHGSVPSVKHWRRSVDWKSFHGPDCPKGVTEHIIRPGLSKRMLW